MIQRTPSDSTLPCVPTAGYSSRFDTTDAVTFDTTDALPLDTPVRPYSGLHVTL
ncbi:hypothetical protein [uncultured Porphyromonas sp.]|uniref:hypothetical protein n=1 Tax=uncultured Porphyromonas sp. TaxID=159274 RepID=UPI0026362FB1|nr:hypothetical protein [uncultured Porphyromonas sp.]